MEYPGTKLIKPIRRAIFVFFVALFLILSPAIIMYTSGYRYDFQNGLLKETGSLNIDVLPSTAEVFFNNIKIKSEIPVRLNNLTPGKYTVTIKKEGYFDWYKNIEINNKETVYIKDVVLLKKNLPTLIHDGTVEEIAFSPDAQYLVYSIKKNDRKEIWQKKTTDDTEAMIVEFTNTDPLQLIFSPNNNFYAISKKQSPYTQVLIINPERPEKISDLAKSSKIPITKYQWKETLSPEIYYSTEKQLMTFFPDNGNQTFITKNTFTDWFMENGQLWILTDNTSTKKAELIKDYLGFNNLFSEDFETSADFWQILTAKDGVVLIKKKNQPEMTLFSNNKKYAIAGEKYLFSKYNNWFISWTPWEIWTRAQNEEPVLLNRSGLQLQEIIPLDKYNTLGLIWAENTSVLFPYYLVSHDLIDQKINTAVSDSDKRILYFGGKYNDKEGLWKLEY
ncbi:MAG TPA: PEGA domain-containing protein [Candidatus Magasanikbacteria bacterium]|nr:PEGA domain-containing protein [Candidatus Magasanikbacteria bacterium]